MIKEMVVVEGIHDQQKLESVFPGIECIVTNGSAVSEETIELIEQANELRGVILFLDPDSPGKKITHQILERVPNVKIAFLNKKAAISKNRKKVGVEHATPEDLRFALSDLFEIQNETTDIVTQDDLIHLGLLNGTVSRRLRNVACEQLRIPVCNGKTFLKLVNRLSIPVSRIEEVVQK